MGGVNGSLLRRLVLVEERAPRPTPVEKFPHAAGFWEQVRAVAAEPVWTYFCQVDAECAAEKTLDGFFDADAWLKREHPCADDVLEGLSRAVQKYRHDGGDSDWHNNTRSLVLVRYTAGWVIQWATARLGMVYATERPGAGVTTSVVIDRVVQERAAHDLLGWTIAESYRQWSDPCAFLEQWRSNGVIDHTISADVLAKAGLHAAELQLLEEDA